MMRSWGPQGTVAIVQFLGLQFKGTLGPKVLISLEGVESQARVSKGAEFNLG